jgi:hypothetical protein
MHAIIAVFELPPKACLSILVNFESRYGMNDPFLGSAKMLIHFPRVNKLLFMFTPSKNRLVWFCDVF